MRVKVALIAAVVLAASVVGSAQAPGALAGGGFVPGLNPNSPIRVLPVRGNIYVLMGAGANITVSVGLDGVLMVDSGSANMSEEVLAAIRGIQRFHEARVAASSPSVQFGAETRNSVIEARRADAPPKPIRYIIATSAAPDHVGGNARIAAAGDTFTGGNVAGQLGDVGEGAAILAHENVQVRLGTPAAGQPATPARAMPTDTYYGSAMKMSTFFNGEGIVLLHPSAAYTDGDTMVHFRGSDVIAAGNVYLTTSYPVIDVAAGGTINGVIEALNTLVDLSVAEFRSEGGTLVIPAYGRISDVADVAYYRDMVTIIRDRVQDMAKKGMTLDQIKAAKVTLDYDGLYEGTSGTWTTDKFLEAVYKTLPRDAVKPAAAPATGARPNARTR